MSFHAEVLCYPISMPRADDNPWVALWHCLTKNAKEPGKVSKSHIGQT